MAASTKSIEYPSIGFRFRVGRLNIRKSVVIMLVFITLIFLAALYYVELQVRLQKLNYQMIELKQQRKELLEKQKTYQLQLHQLSRLDRIEQHIKKRGFIPVEKEQLRIVSKASPQNK